MIMVVLMMPVKRWNISNESNNAVKQKNCCWPRWWGYDHTGDDDDGSGGGEGDDDDDDDELMIYVKWMKKLTELLVYERIAAAV